MASGIFRAEKVFMKVTNENVLEIVLLFGKKTGSVSFKNRQTIRLYTVYRAHVHDISLHIHHVQSLQYI